MNDREKWFCLNHEAETLRLLINRAHELQGTVFDMRHALIMEDSKNQKYVNHLTNIYNFLIESKHELESYRWDKENQAKAIEGV